MQISPYQGAPLNQLVPGMQGMYERCPKHTNLEMILFDYANMEPLCKECLKLDLQGHKQQGTAARVDLIENVRLQAYEDIHNMKLRFEEERAILHHFSDGEHSELAKTVHEKIQRAKQKIFTMVEQYCQQMENMVREKLQSHKAAHPGEKKEIHQRLNSVIQQLAQQEAQLLSPQYIKPMLIILMEEVNHDFDGISTQIDDAVKHYLQNMFDVHHDEQVLQQISQDLHKFVYIEPANLQEEIEIFQKKFRHGKNLYGMDKLQPVDNLKGNTGNPYQNISTNLPSGNKNYLPQPQQGYAPPIRNNTQSSQKSQPNPNQVPNTGFTQPYKAQVANQLKGPNQSVNYQPNSSQLQKKYDL